MVIVTAFFKRFNFSSYLLFSTKLQRENTTVARALSAHSFIRHIPLRLIIVRDPVRKPLIAERSQRKFHFVEEVNKELSNSDISHRICMDDRSSFETLPSTRKLPFHSLRNVFRGWDFHCCTLLVEALHRKLKRIERWFKMSRVKPHDKKSVRYS